MKHYEPVIEIYVGERTERRFVPKWVAVAGGIAFGLACVYAIYVVCMDILPYVLRML